MIKTKLFVGLSTLLALTTACSSGSDNEPTGEGTLTLSLLPSTAFTRAINEADFTTVNNYTVELYNGETQLWSRPYSELSLNETIDAGTYRLVAHYGNNPVAALDELYVAGSTEFTIQAGESKQVNLSCVPANAKVVVKTSDDFATYFTDYQVSLLAGDMTSPLVYSKKDVETDGKDAYVRTDDANGTQVTLTFGLTPAQNVTVTKTLESFTRTLKPQDCLTITLTPDVSLVEGGTVDGITITIDDSVSTEDINITLPSDWI
jgi:hypothetical protein